MFSSVKWANNIDPHRGLEIRRVPHPEGLPAPTGHLESSSSLSYQPRGLSSGTSSSSEGGGHGHGHLSSVVPPPSAVLFSTASGSVSPRSQPESRRSCFCSNVHTKTGSSLFLSLSTPVSSPSVQIIAEAFHPLTSSPGGFGTLHRLRQPLGVLECLPL